MLTITGDSGDNAIEGTSDNEVIIGDGGSDTLVGGAGNDVLIGDNAVISELILNGGFETGDFSGWTVNDRAGGSGSVFVNSGTSTPLSGFATAGAASGTFYAVSDQNGAGTHALSQLFTVAAGIVVVFATFEMFVNDQSGTGPIVDSAGLDHTTTSNQHARVDIIASGADPFDTTSGVIQNLFLGIDSGANPNPYTSYSFDVTAAVGAGGDFVLRFAEVDNLNFFHQGIDDVSLQTVVAAAVDALDGNDVLQGGAGDDTYVASAGNDVIIDALGSNTVIIDGELEIHDVVRSGNDLVITVEDEADGLHTTTVVDHFAGQSIARMAFRIEDDDVARASFDVATGSGDGTTVNRTLFVADPAGTTLTGGSADDVLIGGVGDDHLVANAGDDFLLGGGGNDTLDGGAGIDAAAYFTAGAGVTVDLGNSAAQNTGGAGTDTLASIENVFGSEFADALTGDANANKLFGEDGNDILSGSDGDDILDGGGGNDTLDGGAGMDAAVYFGAGGGVTVDLGDSAPQDTGGAGIDTLTAIENAFGSKFADILTGDANANVLFGESGNDVLSGGDGDDLLNGGGGDDTLDGGNGFDLVSYRLGALNGIVYTGGDGGAASTVAGGASLGTDTLINVEMIEGTAHDDVFTGGDDDERFDPLGGTDALDGGAGKDLIAYAGIGASPGQTGVTITFTSVGSGTAVHSAGTATFVNIEEALGSNGDDTITGSAGDEQIFATGGNDTLDGGAGNDTLNFGGTSVGVTGAFVDLTSGTASDGAGSTGVVLNFENVFGSDQSDTLIGDAGANVLSGGFGGNNHLEGRDGVDLLNGGDGADVLDGGNDTDTLLGGAGDDTLIGGTGGDVITPGDGSDIIRYMAADEGGDTITGFVSGTDSLLFLRSAFNGDNTVVDGSLDSGTFVKSDGAVALDTDDFFLFDTLTGTLSYDADGSDPGAAVNVATFDNTDLLAADITFA